MLKLRIVVLESKNMDHKTWIVRVCGSDTDYMIAKKARLPLATLSRRLKSGTLTAEIVLKISVAYGISPMKAFLDTRFIDPENVEVGFLFAGISSREIADELVRRTGDSEPTRTVLEDDRGPEDNPA